MMGPVPPDSSKDPKDSDLEELSSEELVFEAKAVGFHIDPDDDLSRREIIDAILDYRSEYEDDTNEMNSQTKAELIAWADAWGYDFQRSGTKAEIIEDLRGYW